MGMTLYELAGKNPALTFSPHCWKSRFALAHKGFDPEMAAVRFTEKKKIAFSQQPLVPVLTDGDKVIVDSWAIANYLEKQYPEKPSLFINTAGKTVAESINHWTDNSLALLIRPIVLMDIYRLITPADQVYFRESREQKLGTTLEKFAEKREQSIVSLREELQSVRETLTTQPFIGGDSPTYADHCLASTFMWIYCTSDTAFVESSDVVHQWFKTMLDQYDGLGRRAVRG